MTVFTAAINGVTRWWSSKQAEQLVLPGESYAGHGEPRAIVGISTQNAGMNYAGMNYANNTWAKKMTD